MLGKLDPYFILYTKITQNESKPKCESVKNYKILRRTHRENLHDIGLGNNFLDTKAKAQLKKEIKKQINWT